MKPGIPYDREVLHLITIAPSINALTPRRSPINSTREIKRLFMHMVVLADIHVSSYMREDRVSSLPAYLMTYLYIYALIEYHKVYVNS